MPTAEEILNYLEDKYELDVAYVRFPEGTLPEPNEQATIGRISRGLRQSYVLTPVSIAVILGEEHLKFSEPISWQAGQSDLSKIDLKLHEGLEFMIFGRRWRNSQLQRVAE